MNGFVVIDIGSDAESHFYFKCDICDEFFSSREKLAKHLKHHSCSDPSCTSCNPSLGLQLNREATSNICCSTLNGKRNNSEFNLSSRDTSPLNENPDEEKIYYEALSIHGLKKVVSHRALAQRGTHVFFCFECEETFKSKWALYEHETFVCQSDLVDPIISSKDYILTNDINDELPRSKEGLSTGKESLFKCEECDASFKKKFNLERHAKACHPLARHAEISLESGRESFNCMLCKSVFLSRQSLKRHLNLKHFHTQYFICKICKKTFYQQRYCKEHMSTHSNFRKFGCKLCDKSYKTRYGLNKHMRAHNSTKL